VICDKIKCNLHLLFQYPSILFRLSFQAMNKICGKC